MRSSARRSRPPRRRRARRRRTRRRTRSSRRSTSTDGTITDDELLVACLERGVAEEEIATLFETIDLNGDGVISKDEWRQGFAKFTAAAEAESEAAEEAAEAEAERKAARDASARNREKRPQSARGGGATARGMGNSAEEVAARGRKAFERLQGTWLVTSEDRASSGMWVVTGEHAIFPMQNERKFDVCVNGEQVTLERKSEGYHATLLRFEGDDFVVWNGGAYWTRLDGAWTFPQADGTLGRCVVAGRDVKWVDGREVRFGYDSRKSQLTAPFENPPGRIVGAKELGSKIQWEQGDRSFEWQRDASAAEEAATHRGEMHADKEFEVDPEDNMWFLVSKRHASDFDHEEVKECDNDAWEGHSNRSAMLADYLCVRLTKAQLMSQRQRVRVASYRWQGVKREGKMGLTAPNNYEWFLAFIDAEALVGWMDFMSNVIVGVETKLTLAYMGMLYAEVPTCAEWLREPSKIPEAMSRGWIYQESTFGQLDPSLARQLSDYLYDEYRKEHTPASARAMVEMIWNIALLLLRRGHENAFTADPEDMGGWGKYYDRQRGFFIGGAAAAYWEGLHPSAAGVVTSLLQTEEQVGITIVHLIESIATRTRDELRGWLGKRLCGKASEVAPTAEAFLKRFSLGMLRAYCGASFTSEPDRDVAITASALHILQRDYEYTTTEGKAMTSADLLQECWKEAAQVCFAHEVTCSFGCKVRTPCRVFGKSGYTVAHLHVLPRGTSTNFEGTRYNLAEAPFFKTDPATRRYTQLGVMLQMNGGGDVAEIKLGSA